MRKLTYYVACTVDGFIAHTDGSIDGFMGPETDFDFVASLQAFDVVLMGRKTYRNSYLVLHYRVKHDAPSDAATPTAAE